MTRPRDTGLLRRTGRRLKEAREAAGWTQERLAEAISSQAATISRFEAGALGPTLTTLYSLAKALGVPVAQLVDVKTELSNPDTSDARELASLWESLGPDDKGLVLSITREFVRARRTRSDKSR